MVKGWIETKLEKVGYFTKGSGIPKDEAQSGKIPCVRYGEIYTRHNDFIKRFYSHISQRVANGAYLLKQGDILFACSGETKEEIGKCIAFTQDITAYAGGDIIVLSPFSGYNSLFLGYLLNTETVVKQKASRGQGDAIVHISSASLKEIDIVIPKDETEQAAIAKVLSDMDDYILSLEKLIVKKNDIKKGAMQSLLTGKVRLPGFTGEWTSASGIFRFHKGEQCSSEDIGTYPHYNGGQINSGYTNKYNAINKIIISEGGNSCGFVNRINGKFWAGGHCYIIDDAGFYIEYLYQLLKFCEPKIMDLRVGSGLPNIQKKALREFSFFYTNNEEEQTAIATILSDMDNEIEALTAKLNKARLVKQGAMQQLLTGKIRLIESAPAEQETPKTIVAAKPAHNKEFEDAVIIAAIVNGFYNPQYRLGRVKVTKLRYLFDRKRGADVSSYMEKAAGPYDPSVRYSGGEAVAKRNGYITVTETKGKGASFGKGAKIGGVQSYIDKWDFGSTIAWLKGFLKWSREDLEVLATVDNARLKIEEQGQTATVKNVIAYIENSNEWKAKRSRESYADEIIAEALKQSRELFDGNKGDE
jgi:type I restriction enzyme S subunit